MLGRLVEAKADNNEDEVHHDCYGLISIFLQEPLSSYGVYRRQTRTISDEHENYPTLGVVLNKRTGYWWIMRCL